MSQSNVSVSVPLSLPHRAFDWWLVQMRHALPPTIFFFIGFNLILWTKRLILEEHGIDFSGFFTATVAALLVGKAVLVTDSLPFMRRFEGAPLIQPILFKTAIYWLCVLIVRLAEGLVHFLAGGGVIALFPAYFVDRFSWPRFLSIQLWLMVLFLVYVTVHELNELFGNGETFPSILSLALIRSQTHPPPTRSPASDSTDSQRRIQSKLLANRGRPNILNWSASCGSSRRRPRT